MQTTGNSSPLGATVGYGGVNFSLFSKNGTLVELLLFDRMDDAKPSKVIPLDPRKNRTYRYWHVFVPDLQPGQIYGCDNVRAGEPSSVQLLLAWNVVQHLGVVTVSAMACVR